MSDFKRARQLHKLLDEVEEGRVLDYSDMQQLRAALPELPKQNTLGELTMLVYDAWLNTSGNEWGGDTDNPDGFIEDWLSELYVQMNGLKDAPSPVPALPEGMRIADHKVRGRCVVSPKTDEDGDFLVFTTDKGCETGAHYLWLHPEHLTFIDPEPGHPEFLETEEDYKNAPEGTIVVSDGGVPCHKFHDKWSSAAFCALKDDRGMSRTCRRVLRWGNE